MTARLSGLFALFGRAFIGFSPSLTLLKTFPQHGDEIHDVGWPLFPGRGRGGFVAMLDLFLNQVLQGFGVVVRIIRGLPL